MLANNHENFAPKGNIVATVPPGTGVMIMANDQVEVFDNTIEQNQTAGLSIVSYLITDKPIKDDEVRPVLRGDLTSTTTASRPTARSRPARSGELLATALGTPLPDILYDGIVDPKKLVDGKLPDALAIRIHNNGKAGFANFDAPGPEGVRRTGAATRSRGAEDHPRPQGVRRASSPPWSPSRSRALK